MQFWIQLQFTAYFHGDDFYFSDDRWVDCLRKIVSHMYGHHGYDAETYFEKGPEQTTDNDSMGNESTASSNSADDMDLSDPTMSDESYIQPQSSTPHAQPRSTPLVHPSPTPTEPPQLSTPKTASLLMPLVRSGKRNWGILKMTRL